MNKREAMIKSCEYYLEHKISVIPVWKDKKPLISWKEFQDRFATIDEVKKWLDDFPDMQLGWVTWKISSLIVVDVEEWWDVSWLPKTAIVNTWWGWFHYYYSYVPGMTNKVRIKHLTDIRSDGWYVVLPPSVSNKGHYSWKVKVQPIPFPINLFDVEKESLSSNLSIEWYKWFGKGERNNEMAKYIWFVLAKTHPSIWEDVSWGIIKSANEKNTPPLNESELKNTFDSIKNMETRNNRDRWYKKNEAEKDSNVWKEEENKVLLLSDIAKKEEFQESEKYLTRIDMIDEATEWWFKDWDLIIVSWASWFGKCHGKWTKIMMHDWSIKNVEDIKKWELLMWDDQTPRNVLSLARWTEEMYSIRNIKWEELYTVNSSHILSLRRTWKSDIVNISVKDYLNSSKNFKILHKWYRVWLDFNEKELEIDPHLLWLWLWDWDSNWARITTQDKEVIDYMKSYAEKNDLVVHEYEQKNNKSNIYSISRKKDELWFLKVISLKEKLRNLNLIKNKHIPDIYKFNSRENRLKLLAWLIDSDWHQVGNCYEVTQKNKRLSEDIVWLARSLWMWATIRKITKTIKSIWFSWEYYYIWIYWELSDIPVLLKYKKCHKRLQHKNVLNYWISVVPIGIDNYYWFELDWNHLYVLWDFSVTHNTTLCQCLSVNFAEQWLPVIFFSYEVLVSHLWKKFKAMLRTEDLPIYSVEKHTTGNVWWLQEKIAEAKRNYGIKIVVIDHLGFLIPKHRLEASGNYATYVGQVVRELKTLAKDEKIIIILPVHVRKTDDPGMNDLKDSSSISQESDMVLILNRERNLSDMSSEYYTDYVKIFSVKNRSTWKNVQWWFKLEDGRFVQEKYYVPIEATKKKTYWKF